MTHWACSDQKPIGDGHCKTKHQGKIQEHLYEIGCRGQEQMILWKTLAFQSFWCVSKLIQLITKWFAEKKKTLIYFLHWNNSCYIFLWRFICHGYFDFKSTRSDAWLSPPIPSALPTLAVNPLVTATAKQNTKAKHKILLMIRIFSVF